MRFDKQSEEWGRRGLELEKRGIVPGNIGSEARIERLKLWRRKARFYRSLVVRAAKSQLKITIVEKPELAGNCVTLGMILELPLQGDGRALSGKAGSAFEALVKGAVGTGRKPMRRRVRKSKLA